MHRSAKTYVIMVVSISISLLLLWYLMQYTLEEKAVSRRMVEGVLENIDKVSKCLNMRHSVRFSMACETGSIRRGGMCIQCPGGTFTLPHWTVCKRWLTCSDMSRDVRISKLLYSLGDWQYFLAEWKNYEVIYAKSLAVTSEISFDALQELAPHSNFLHPIGFCQAKQVVLFSMDDVILNPANQLNSILKKTDCDYWPVRFQLCLDYLSVLSHLHSSIGGPYVLCNSNNASHILTQFLISSDLRLIFANFDNLPQVLDGKQPVKCSRRELQVDFIAPEQLWPFSQLKVFNFDEQPGYNEKTDVWKVPDVTRALFLSESHKPGSEKVLDYLVAMHYRCKKLSPNDRPTAMEILKEYELVWQLLLNFLDSGHDIANSASQPTHDGN